MVDLDSFLSESEFSPGDINFLRMDVQGFESSVLKGASEIISADRPLVLFVEIHSSQANSENHVIELLKSYNFDVVSVVGGHWYEEKFEIEQIDDIYPILSNRSSVEVILRK